MLFFDILLLKFSGISLTLPMPIEIGQNFKGSMKPYFECDFFKGASGLGYLVL